MKAGGRLRFNVFGEIMVAERFDSEWRLFILGNDGKRRRCDVVIPAFIKESELAQYLDDIFHERATRERPSVILLP